jgi:peptidoglycan/LPS O-acetylase OafA/YrhL
MQKRLYFTTFDALRFFAFLKIFLYHLPVIKENIFTNILFGGGGTGVDFFFVLSGFLISYLLAYEKLKTKKIDGKNYFMRRALRIWPLFFVAVIIGYINNAATSFLQVGGSLGYNPNPLFSFTFLENYKMIMEDTFPNGSPLRVIWSVCVEEHFYILWFLLFVFVPFKKIPVACVILWIIGIAYRHAFYFLLPGKIFYYDTDVVSKLDYFCCGGLVGYFTALKPEKIKSWINKIPKILLNTITILIIILFFFHQFFIPENRITDLYEPVISSALFSILIMLIVSSGSFLFFKKENIFSKLGRISYGLYIYHTVIISGLLLLIKHFDINLENYFIYIIFCTVCFICSVLISHISYKYFEQKFLKLKNKYAS